MTWKKAGSSSVTRTSVRAVVAALRVVHRRVVSSGAGERGLTSVLNDQNRGGVPCFDAFSSREPVSTPHQVRRRLPRRRYAIASKLRVAKSRRRGHELPVADPGAIKKSRTSGLFWGLLWNNITDRFSAGRH